MRAILLFKYKYLAVFAVARKVRKNMRDYPAASVEYSNPRRYNGNNNENIVRLIFYEHTFSLAAVTIHAFWFSFKRKVLSLYKFKLEFRDAPVCMIIGRIRKNSNAQTSGLSITGYSNIV